MVDSLNCSQLFEKYSKSYVTVNMKNLSLYFTEHHDMKMFGGSGCIPPRILSLGTRREVFT
jgi:hypothetical protein